MKRRSALRGLIAAGVISGAPLQALAETVRQKLQLINSGLRIKERFAAALKHQPALLGYASAAQSDYQTTDISLSGEWPAGLKGTLYRNGPAGHEIGEFRYQHWFDGDGMLQAFHLDGPRIAHRARMIRTSKYQQEQAAGQPLFPGFGTEVPAQQGVANADELNPANISVLVHHSKLFALWEAGSPYELNTTDLKTIGRHVFSQATDGVPFSAHPRVEADGTLWNFGYASAAKKLAIWHLGPAGDVKRTGVIDCDPITMVHDFVVTKRHLVFLICPLHYNSEKPATSFLDAHDWQPQMATQVLVINKDDFSQVQRLELPAQWVFHFSNAWEDTRGIIHFEAARSPDPSILSTTFASIMQGEMTASSPSHLYSYRINTKRGKVEETALRTDGSCDFPVVSPWIAGKQHPQLLLLSENQSPHTGLNQISLLNMYNQTEQRFKYPDHLIPEEPLLIGTPDREGNLPWVLGTALNYREKQTELYLFGSENLGAGPIASARLPYALPLGLHGKFYSA